MSLRLRFAVRSDVGLLREGNEDAAYAGPTLLAVADGMGGHAAGEVASRLAIASVASLDGDFNGELNGELKGDGEPDILTSLRAAVERAQEHIRHRVAADQALDGMGTTLTALVWTGTSLGLVHVGDSRAYLLRDGTLQRITHDHTYVQELVDSEQITAEEAQSHPQRSLLTRAIDGRSHVEPDLAIREVRVGDRYLICSDGLCGVVTDASMATALQAPDVATAADKLVDLALRGGGPDNITVVVCDLIEADEGLLDPVVVGAASDLAVPSRRADTAADRAVLAQDEPTRRRGQRSAGTTGRTSPRRPAWTVLAIGLVVVLATLGGWLWTRTQYFVGVSGERVTIFRGVAWSVAGLSLHSVSEQVAVDPARLPEFERERLRAGIAGPTLPQARRVADRLAGEVCPVPAAGTVPAPGRFQPPEPSQPPVQGQPSRRARRRRPPVPREPAEVRSSDGHGPERVRGVRRRRRWVELAMLVFAVLIIAVAYLNVGYARSGTIPTDTLSYAASLGGLFLIAHLALWALAPYADPLLLPLVALLNGIGLVVIHRLDLASTDRARQLGRATLPRSDAPLQLAWTAIGIGLFVATLLLVRDHRMLQRFTYTAMAAGIVLLLIPAVLPARFSEVNGARIWIRVAGLSFQPGEVAKILLIIFFAGYFVAKRELLSLMSRRVFGLDIPRARDLGPVLVAWLASVAVLVVERDLGTSLLFFGIFVAMLYVATRKVSWIALGVLLFAGGAYLAYHLFGHVQDRVDAWLHPFRYASTTGYQLVQGLFGLANGGVFGTGLGQGRPDIVPFAKSDFITTSIGEELGLGGLMAVLVIFLLISMRGIKAGLAVSDDFGRLLATGLAFAFALQVFVVVGGVTRLIPLTGLTLPFMSYGGSSLVANWALIALLLRISDAGRRPPPATTSSGPATLEGELQTDVLRGLGRP